MTLLYIVVVVSKETGYKNRDPGEGKGDRIGESNSSGLKLLHLSGCWWEHCCFVTVIRGRREGQPRLVAVNMI